jgi:hypothetical protein
MDINPNLTLDQVVSQQKQEAKALRQQNGSNSRGGGSRGGRGGGGRGGGGGSGGVGFGWSNGGGGDDDNDMSAIVVDRTVRVFIRNIPLALIERFDDKALLNELNEAGGAGTNSVSRYTLYTNRAGHYTQCAMATFCTAEAANRAIKELNGKVFEDNADKPLYLEHAKEHGVVEQRKLNHAEAERRLETEPWKHDLYGANTGSASGNFRPFGGGGGGRGAGGGRGGRGRGAGRGGMVSAIDLDSELNGFLQ